MIKFKLNKLVRDKIVQFNDADGVKSYYQILDDEEYIKALKLKILEEAKELSDADSNEIAKELADIQEAIDCLTEQIGVSGKEFKEFQKKRSKAKGSYKKKIFIETIDVPDDSKWVEYYRKRADRHPEIE